MQPEFFYFARDSHRTHTKHSQVEQQKAEIKTYHRSLKLYSSLTKGDIPYWKTFYKDFSTCLPQSALRAGKKTLNSLVRYWTHRGRERERMGGGMGYKADEKSDSGASSSGWPSIPDSALTIAPDLTWEVLTASISFYIFCQRHSEQKRKIYCR